MEAESLHQPTALAIFELDVEEEAATIDEVGPWALQFVKASFKGCELWNSVFSAFNSPAVNLAGEILSQPPPQQGGRFYEHRAESGFHLAIAISCEMQKIFFGAQATVPPKASSGRIARTSDRRLRRLGAVDSRRSATAWLVSNNTAPPLVNDTTLRSSAATSFGSQ